MQISPDRLRHLVRHRLICTCRPRRGTDRRAVTFKEIVPSGFVTLLAGNYQTQIISMQAIEKFVDDRWISRRVVLKDIFLDPGPQPRRQRQIVQRPRPGRPGQETPGSRQNQFVYLLRIFAQTVSNWPTLNPNQIVALCYHDPFDLDSANWAANLNLMKSNGWGCRCSLDD